MNEAEKMGYITYEKFLTDFQISRATGDRMRSKGILKTYRLFGGRLLYVKKDELEDLFKEDGEQEAAA